MKIYGKLIKAILDTGSLLTLISLGVYGEMDREFEEEGNRVSSVVRNSKLKLFSCQRNQAVATSGECDVKLEHDDFQGIRPVIVEKRLAHECLIGMNVLVRWPAMKEAIRVLDNRQQESKRDNNSLSDNIQFARLNNICLPRIMVDSELKSKLLAKSAMIQAPETEVIEVQLQTDETNAMLNSRGDVELVELAEEVCEEEFRAKYMPEDRGSDMAINFNLTEADSRDKVHTKEEVGKTFGTVESMIKGVPQLLNVKDGKVGKAKNCAHEIHLKPRTITVKHRVRRIPVHLRDELKASIDTMLGSGIIRRSKSEWSEPIVLVRKKYGSRRLCVDYKDLDNETVKDTYPLSRIDNLIFRRYQLEIATAVDRIEGFKQVKLLK